MNNLITENKSFFLFGFRICLSEDKISFSEKDKKTKGHFVVSVLLSFCLKILILYSMYLCRYPVVRMFNSKYYTSIEILTFPPSPFSTMSKSVLNVILLPSFSTREM